MQAPYEELFTRNIGFVDENEQTLLRTARIAVLGVGGMGGVVAQILARSGVGALNLLDKDAFEPSNNNRQVYARTDTWGRPKVEVTAEELRKVNPELKLLVGDHFGADNADEMIRGCDVVVNGMDELGACLRLWRAARKHGVPVVDAWSAPLPNVFVIRPGEPLPEEFLAYPTLALEPEALTRELIDEAKVREALHVALHSSSLRYLDMQIISEILSGERARISFAPMVWGAALLMAWEALKLRLHRGEVASCFGRFFDPWTGRARDARGFLPFERELVRRAYARFFERE
jgi:molybdopterin-synthase adenylyltransferase